MIRCEERIRDNKQKVTILGMEGGSEHLMIVGDGEEGMKEQRYRKENY